MKSFVFVRSGAKREKSNRKVIGKMPFGKSPLEALEIMKMPGVILAYKYTQFRQRRREAESRRVTERELNALHHKIVSFCGFSL